MMNIRDMVPSDITQVAAIHREAFPNDTVSERDSLTVVSSKFLGWPVNRYFVAVEDNDVIGYIVWVEMGGLRVHCVLELEQIAVLSNRRGRSVGTRLIQESLVQISKYLRLQNRHIKLVEVSTGSSNEAQRLYQNTLGATVQCKKSDFFDEDEVVMIARVSSMNDCLQRKGYPLLEVV